MSPAQIIQKHPAPWRYVANGGNVIMIDGIGRQVELFTMLDFAVGVTAQIVADRAASVSPEMSASAAL